MTEYRYSWLFAALLIWPVIVNAQPGAEFIFLGIDWKTDDLDNTLFWMGIFFFIIFLLASAFGDKLRSDNKAKNKHDQIL